MNECEKRAKWQAMMAKVNDDKPLINREPHPEAILLMSAEELIEYARGEQLKSVMRFIDGCTAEEAARIISEINVCHDVEARIDDGKGWYELSSIKVFADSSNTVVIKVSSCK